MTALVVFAAAGWFAWAALGPDGSTAGSTGSGTYILSDFEVTAHVDRESEEVDSTQADVGFAMHWSSNEYPGAHSCTLRVFDPEGAQIGSVSVEMDSLQKDSLSSMPLAITGSIDGATATGSCGPERLDTPIAYEISDVHLIDDLTVSYVAGWPDSLSEGEYPGTNACTVALFQDGDLVAQKHLTLAVGDQQEVTSTQFSNLNDQAWLIHPAGLDVTVACEPYVQEDVYPDATPPASAAEASPPNILGVSCDGESIALHDGRVSADPAGVHVRIENGANVGLYFQFAAGELGPWGGMKVSPGTTDLAIQLPPGTATVRCSDGDSTVTEEVPVEVVDADGVFVPYSLACADGSMRLTPAVTQWAPRDSDLPDPVAVVRAVVLGVVPSDVLELGSYPQAANPVVRLVRGGDVVAVFDLSVKGTEWAVSYVACTGAGISLPPQPDPYPRGAFEWCPGPPFPEPGRAWSEHASAAALRFVGAHTDGDEAAVAELLDPFVPTGAEFPVELAQDMVEPSVISTNAAGGPLVEFACGTDAAAYTVAITMDDGTDSASLDFTVYLVHRDNGWKVWALY